MIPTGYVCGGVGLAPAAGCDDVQDTTLAGMRFLEELGNAGVKLVLVGNPDESVQTSADRIRNI